MWLLVAGCLGHVLPRGERLLHQHRMARSGVHYSQDSFLQLRNHDDASEGNFSQRYWQVLDWVVDVKDIRVAILTIGGEADEWSVGGIGDFAGVLAQDLGAAVFTLEHRFYGESFPGPATVENYEKWFSVHQAVEDLTAFARGIGSVTGYGMGATRWLIAGGSYAGGLASWTRTAHPDVFSAALSSSGVVEANDTFTNFDLQIAQSVGEECGAVLRGVRAVIEAALGSGDEDLISWHLTNLGMNFGELPNWRKDVLFALADAFSLGPQYGRRGPLCRSLTDAVANGDDPILAFGAYVRGPWTQLAGDVRSAYSRDEMMGMDGRLNQTAPRAWLWQTCSELGYWQSSPGRIGLRPNGLTTEWFEEQCADVFGDAHKHPDVAAFNAKWGGLTPNVTHVFYSTGSQDPWTWVCVNPSNGVAVPLGSAARTSVGDEVGHCSDWWAAPSNTEVQRTQDLERKLLTAWLAE